MPSYYKNDPYVLTVRYPASCSGCGDQIRKGASAFYYPKGKRLFGMGGRPCTCGDTERASFEAAAMDEDLYSMGYGV